MPTSKTRMVAILLTVGLFGYACGPVAAAVRIEGQVQGGGAPITKSTVTLWAASASAPTQLAQTQTGADGRFEVSVEQSPSDDTSLYLIATGGEATGNKQGGDNPAIALMTVLGNKPPAEVVINEMTTVASVWTNAQFLDGTVIKGPALSLRIVAGNVPNFVDLQTGGWGAAIQDPLNSGQTPTMGNWSRATASNSAWLGLWSSGIWALGAAAGSQRTGLLLPTPRGSNVTTSKCCWNSGTCWSSRISPAMVSMMPAPGPPGSSISTPLRLVGSIAGARARWIVILAPSGLA